MAVRLYAEYHQEVQERHNVTVVATHDKPADMAKMLAILGCLRSFVYDRNHRAMFFIVQEGVRRYYTISANTILKMGDLVEKLIYGRRDDAPHDPDSEELMSEHMTQWEEMRFEFIAARITNILDPPAYMGGRFPHREVFWNTYIQVKKICRNMESTRNLM
jgi:hypothetical protein